MITLRLTALALISTATALITSQPANAGGNSIYEATLAEQGARTPEVSTEQMRRIISDGKTLIIDTRGAAEFDAGHIPGAVRLAGEGNARLDAVTRLAGGDKSKEMVLYCNGPFCQASRRLADDLKSHGFTNVSRYQLGLPVWRALGGPTVIELEGVRRIQKGDALAVYIDARAASEFGKGSLPKAISAPVDDILSGQLKKIALPEDDFNRRIVLFGRDGAQAKRLAEYMSKRPWHNVMYFPGTFADLSAALASNR